MASSDENGISFRSYEGDNSSYERTYVDAGHPRFQEKYYCPGCKMNFKKTPQSVVHHFESKVHEEKLPKCLKCKESVFQYMNDRRKKVYEYCGCYNNEMSPVIEKTQINLVPAVKAEKRKIDPLSETQIPALEDVTYVETAEEDLNLSPKKQKTEEDKDIVLSDSEV